MLKQTINEVLSGNTLKSALDFVDFLEANEMVAGDGVISYKGNDVCYIHLDAGKDYPLNRFEFNIGGFTMITFAIEKQDQ